MGLLEVGSWGYQIGALGIVTFTVSFLMVVRWWTDLLGRVLAFVFTITSIVLLLSAYRSLTHADSENFMIVRLVVYWTYGVGVWGGIVSFLWFQFFAPRVKHLTTRRDRQNEESTMAGSRNDRDGGSDRHSGGDR